MTLASPWLAALLFASIAPGPTSTPSAHAGSTRPAHAKWAPMAAPPAAAPAPSGVPILGLHGLAPDAEREYAKGKEKAQAALLPELEDFAGWCQKEKCLVHRNRAYEVVITIDPDHKLARKCLKYKRDRKTKEWTRKGKYREPKAGKPEAQAAARKRRAEINKPYVDAMLGLIDTHGELLKTSFVQGELDELLALAPENPALREHLGFLWVPTEQNKDGEAGRWMLKETQFAKTERARIAGLLTELREEDPQITDGELEAEEKKWGIDWATPLQSRKLRIVFDSEIEDGALEARKLIENMNSSWTLFAQLTGSKSKAPKDFTVYLLSGDGKIPGIIDADADFDDSYKEYLRGVYEYTDSLSLKPASLVCYRETPEHRLDTAISEWVDFYLISTYGGSFLRGWANVGMRHYVTELILGTRMTMPDGVDPSPEFERAAQGGKLPDCLSEANKVMETASTRFLSDLVEMPTFSMSDRHIVGSHALFAYIIEGHDPEVSHKLLRKVARSSDERAGDAFEDTLKIPIETVQRRLGTWLKEIASLTPKKATGAAVDASSEKGKK